MESLSYREVIPINSFHEEWHEIKLNTGGAHSTLQDIKVTEKAGGYCYKNATLKHNRNRFIYWRTYQDVLELSEISLDYNLYQNNLRYKFNNSPILAVTIIEKSENVLILVNTVCSLHCISFPHPDTSPDIGVNKNPTVTTSEYIDSQSFSIFRESNATKAGAATSFYAIDDQTGASSNQVPHAASASISPKDNQAYFAMAYQAQLNLYIMNCETGQTVVHLLREHHIMPRLLFNIKGALIYKNYRMCIFIMFSGKNDANNDAEYATSLTFAYMNNQAYLLALYRNEQLRVWSIDTLQSVCFINCVREGFEQRAQGTQSNTLRKINDHSFCVFLSHATGSEFVLIDLVANTMDNGQLNLIQRKIIVAPPLDLTDFDVCQSRIWALWSNAEGDISISSYCLLHGMGMNWVTAAMEPPPDRYCLGIEQGMDPREAYCSYIFHPGKFEKSVIAKALFMFRRSNVRFEGKHCTMNLLKEHVCQAIEDELQNEIKEFDVTDDDYLEFSTRLWERFYSCCEQYHMKISQPSGLLILEPLDAVCVIKTSTFSLLRPSETLEHLMLAADDVEIDVLLRCQFEGTEAIGKDLVNLMNVLSLLEKWLPEDTKGDFDRKLYQLEMPKELIEKLTDELLAGDSHRELLPPKFLTIIRQKLQSIGNIVNVMSLLLENLRMDHGNPETMRTHGSESGSLYARLLLTYGALFSSQVGLSVLVETVRQMSVIRFTVCRNLLLLQQILINTQSLPVNILEVIRSQFMPDVVICLQAYYIMVWISETPVNTMKASSLETSIQRLHLLQLTSTTNRVSTNSAKGQTAIPLLQVFLNAKGLCIALSLLNDQGNFKDVEEGDWSQTLMPLCTIISHLIWAVSFNFVFGEWLFGTCQHTIIADYVRLLNNWCEWNICSRQFILAVSLLDCGETYKAYDLFLQSAKGVSKEQFLMDKILKSLPEQANANIQNLARLRVQASSSSSEKEQLKVANQCMAQYFLKVIQLFEQHHALDCVISAAQVAIGLLQKDDPQLPMFQSIVFNNHLQLEHYEEAYHSLIYNADPDRRKDCLRQLVITLFQRKRLDLLMQFPYVGLQPEFENIVESRARSQSMEQNEIYDFLYAFHVNNGNMRKASSVMYEQAMRLQLEGDNIEAMQKRCHSLLMCLNALHLIDVRYRWIAKPFMGDEYDLHKFDNYEMHENGKCNNNKNNSNNENNSIDIKNFEERQSDKNYFKLAPKVVVLEVKHIKRELLHIEALLHLSHHRKDVNRFLNAGPTELCMILASTGLFTSAIRLAHGFNVSLVPIFDSLTSACVRAAQENSNAAWSWLQENDLADLPHRSRAVDMVWSLLEKLIKENEASQSTELRKAVVNKLLSLNAFIPQWLYNDYKLANCSEFLYLFVKHQRLLEAANLAQEMLAALMGAGCEYFSFKYAITVTNPELCLPVNTLDLLLYGLKLNSEQHIEYKEALVELEERLHKYIETATRTAQDKIQLNTGVNNVIT